MTLTDEQLIAEAITVNYAEVPKRETLAKYEKHLGHLAAYLRSVHNASFYTARRKHIKQFMTHLQARGGAAPDVSRVACSWCADRGYPDGRGGGPGWSPSTCKSYLAAARFLYTHFAHDEDLPDFDPTGYVRAPKLVVAPQYTPSREEVQAILDAPGGPRDRLLAYWTFYAPSRRATFSNARWKDIDLERGTWDVVGKGSVEDRFPLHGKLVVEFRRYRRWQLEVASRNPAVRDALLDEDTAYVLLTRTGRRVQPQTLSKMLKWRAVRAGVAVKTASSALDAPSGKTSRVSPHAMRRAWADAALNRPYKPVPIDVVAEVLNHRDIATTRRHYARTKPERAEKALREMTL